MNHNHVTINLTLERCVWCLWQRHCLCQLAVDALKPCPPHFNQPAAAALRPQPCGSVKALQMDLHLAPFNASYASLPGLGQSGHHASCTADFHPSQDPCSGKPLPRRPRMPFGSRLRALAARLRHRGERQRQQQPAVPQVADGTADPSWSSDLQPSTSVADEAPHCVVAAAAVQQHQPRPLRGLARRLRRAVGFACRRMRPVVSGRSCCSSAAMDRARACPCVPECKGARLPLLLLLFQLLLVNRHASNEHMPELTTIVTSHLRGHARTALVWLQQKALAAPTACPTAMRATARLPPGPAIAGRTC